MDRYLGEEEGSEPISTMLVAATALVPNLVTAAWAV
jgi:hypothetical protein